MNKTENLGLNLTEDEATRFSDWRQSIDGADTVNKSNMRIIDEFAGTIRSDVDAVDTTVVELKSSITVIEQQLVGLEALLAEV